MKAELFKNQYFSNLRRNAAFWIAIIDVIIILLFGLFSRNHVFLSFGNLENIALDCAAITLVTAGMNLLLGAGELDISIGANIILASVVGGKVMSKTAGGSIENYGVYKHLALGATLGIIATILSGIFVGLIIPVFKFI